jgi:hypothetical protein
MMTCCASGTSFLVKEMVLPHCDAFMERELVSGRFVNELMEDSLCKQKLFLQRSIPPQEPVQTIPAGEAEICTGKCPGRG